jgi:uncharacterized surface anchored protein
MEQMGKNIKRVMIIVAAALFALCMVGIIMVWADANNSEDTPLFKQVLGKAVNFGFVSDEFKQQGDLQSNFATNLFSGGEGIHSDLTNGDHAGDYWITKTQNDIKFSVAGAGKNNGQILDSQYYVTDSVKPHIIGDNIVDQSNQIHIVADDVLRQNVNDLYNSALQQGAELANHKADITKENFKGVDQNNIVIDTTKYGPNDTIYVDGSSCQYFLALNNFKIHKLENQNIVFNIKDPMEEWAGHQKTSLKIGKYYIKVGDGEYFDTETPITVSEKNTKLSNQAKHIFFNVRSTANLDEVKLSATTGVFLIQDADVALEGTSSGWLVTNQKFTNNGNEWHNIYQDTKPEQPTTPDKPTTETGSLKLTKTSTGHNTPDNATFTITKQGETQPAATVTYKQIKDGNGSYTVVNLPIGTYTVKESGADVDGYTLQVDGTKTATVETSKTAEISLTNTYSQKVGTLEIVKTTNGGTTPADTVFTITGPNKYKVEKHYSDFKDGKLTIGNLPVGEYTVKEGNAAVDGYTLNVTGDNDIAKNVEANKTTTDTITNTYTKEQPVKGALRLLKQSKDGTAVAGTTYTLYKWNGTDASQLGAVTRDQIEKTNKDQWTQVENGQKVTDKDGVYTSPELDVGSTYAVMETEATDGYQRTANPAVFTVDTQGKISLIQKANANGAAEIDKDGNMVWYETSVVLQVTKVDEKGAPVKGATFALYDGDKEIECWTTAGKAHQIAASLTAGKTYTLKEIDVPEGYEKAADQTITIEKEDAVSQTENIQSVSMTDKKKPDQKLETKIDKTNITGDKEVPGATIEVVDKTTDKTVDTWRSDGKGPHDIGDKLEAGHTYTLKETSAPTGYAYTTDVTFTVDKDGTIKDANGKTVDNKTVLVKDEALALKVSKTDLTSGKEVSGAKITVYDENGKAVTSWTSDGKEHDFGSSLKAGSNYTIKEDGAPAGYDYINTIKLSVGKDGKMTVTGTEGDFKYDAKTGKLTIQDKKLKNRVYSLKMRKTENVDEKDTDKRISGSRYAMYKWTGQAASAKKRMALRAFAVKAADASTTDSGAQFNNLTRADITAANGWKEIVSSDTDANGEIKADSASNPDITPGVYAFMEQTPPAGYQRTKNPAVIRLKEDGTKEMISDANGAAVLETEGTGDAAVQFLRWRETATNVEIAKVDENGNPVKGAVLAIYDKNGEPVETWTTNGTKHRITAKLIAGDTYTLKELKAPEGYEKAADETFTVEEKDIVGINQYVQGGIDMTDKKTTTTTTNKTTTNKTQTIAQGVKTGDPTTVGGLIAMIAAAGGIAVLAVKRLREAK